MKQTIPENLFRKGKNLFPHPFYVYAHLNKLPHDVPKHKKICTPHKNRLVQRQIFFKKIRLTILSWELIKGFIFLTVF